jgi:AcrR family transcriptional regulator
MPQVTEQHRAARRAEILAAACRCFARDGFHATSIADIIRESDLSAGSVYLYFKSKNEIIAAVVEMTLGTADELFAELLADDATPTPEQTVAFMLDAVMQRAVQHPVLGVDMSRVALHAWAEALRDPEIRIVRNQHTHAFLDELSSFPHGRHDDCVDALAGAHHHVSKLPRHPLRTYLPRGRLPTGAEVAANNLHRVYGHNTIDQIAAMLGARIYDSRNLHH